MGGTGWDTASHDERKTNVTTKLRRELEKECSADEVKQKCRAHGIVYTTKGEAAAALAAALYEESYAPREDSD